MTPVRIGLRFVTHRGLARNLKFMARPRDPSVEPRITAAASELLSEGGYAALTMEGVASRAGVGKPTVYRRWSTRAQLVFELFTRPTVPDPVPDTGSLREDLVELGSWLASTLGTTDRSICGDRVGEMIDSATFSARVLERRIEPDLAVIATIWDRAVDRGEVRDPEEGRELLDDLTGALMYRLLVLHEELGRDEVERLVDRMLLGVLVASNETVGSSR